jgi:hypothetical protein
MTTRRAVLAGAPAVALAATLPLPGGVNLTGSDLETIRAALSQVFRYTGGPLEPDPVEAGMNPDVLELEARARAALRLLDGRAPA